MTPASRRAATCVAVAVALLFVDLPSVAAQVAPEIRLPTGTSRVMDHHAPLTRIAIGDPEIADAVVISPSEILVTGVGAGTTTLVAWDETGGRMVVPLAVTANTALLEEQLASLFGVTDARVSGSGAALVLEGRVSDAGTAVRALEFIRAASGSEITVLDDLEVADRGQVRLRVRFAEVSRSALKEFGLSLLRMDPDDPRGGDEGAIGSGVPLSGSFLEGDGPDLTFSDAVDLFLFHDASHFAAFVRALRNEGFFRSLAEPNLITAPGEEASFLAGGEFPFPVVQGAGVSNAVTLQFKEFGVRLSFTPTFVSPDRIRLRVAPEVSSLDFGNALELSGFRIPVVLTRRAETVVELGDGQTFAIAGLMENTLAESENAVPFLEDLPILGRLFRSEEMRRDETELLVLVTPEIVEPQEVVPPLPGQAADTLPPGSE